MSAPLLNPYLDLFRELAALPEDARLRARKKLIWAYAWAVPDDAAIRAIADHGPVVEMGAGTGYWAWLIGQAGVACTAYDRAPLASPRWVDVRGGGPEVLNAATAPPFPATGVPGAAWPPAAAPTLLLCWPPLDEPLAEAALAAYLAGGGTRVAYVGEWRGRTATDAFHETLEREWRLIDRRELPRWPGFRDELRIYAKSERRIPA